MTLGALEGLRNIKKTKCLAYLVTGLFNRSRFNASLNAMEDCDLSRFAGHAVVVSSSYSVDSMGFDTTKPKLTLFLFIILYNVLGEQSALYIMLICHRMNIPYCNLINL